MRCLGPLLALFLAFQPMAQPKAGVLVVQSCNALWDIPWYGPGPSRVYELDEHSGSYTELAAILAPEFCTLYSLTKRRSDGAYYAVGIEMPGRERRLVRIVPGTWHVEVVAPVVFASHEDALSSEVSALAFSRRDELYAIHHWVERVDGELVAGNRLLRIDPETGAELARSADMGTWISSMDFAPDGTLYGWSPHAGLHTIDIATGAVTDVKDGVEAVQEIGSITVTPEGDLLGSGGSYAGSAGIGRVFRIDPRSGDYRATSYGLLSINLDAIQHLGARLPRLAEERPRRPLRDSLFLIDCQGCPQCFGRICDPRVNEALDRFFIVDPKSDLAEAFSRKELGLRHEDGPLVAGAPVAGGKRPLFVVAAPLADGAHRDAGAVLFFDRKGKLVQRIDGGAADARLGLAMDVRGDEVAVLSRRQLLRLRGAKLVHRTPLDKRLGERGAFRLTFGADMDGDGRPEILIGAPYATVKGREEAGIIQAIGSKSGRVIKTRGGSVARQHVGSSLRHMKEGPWPADK